jgi:hypothetical protein
MARNSDKIDCTEGQFVDSFTVLLPSDGAAFQVVANTFEKFGMEKPAV